MLNIHKRYCTETFDAQGDLTSFRVHVPSGFNFAYDVIDEIGSAERAHGDDLAQPRGRGA